MDDISKFKSALVEYLDGMDKRTYLNTQNQRDVLMIKPM